MYLHQLSQNIGSNTFIRSYSSHFAQENLKGGAQGTHTPYAESDVCRTFAQIVHLGQGLCKEHAIKEEHILHVILQVQIFGGIIPHSVMNLLIILYSFYFAQKLVAILLL